MADDKSISRKPNGEKPQESNSGCIIMIVLMVVFYVFMTWRGSQLADDNDYNPYRDEWRDPFDGSAGGRR